MRKIAVLLGLLMSVALPVFGQVQQRQQIGPVEIVGFNELTVSKSEVIFSGKSVYVHTLDGRLEAKAPKIVMSFAKGSDAKPGTGNLKTIAMTGGVWMKTKPEPGKVTEATASKINVDWAGTKEATLIGGVRIASTDPSMFIGPAVVTADRAVVNLKPDSQLAEGEQRLRIESTTGTSKIEFTPKESEQGKSANQNR